MRDGWAVALALAAAGGALVAHPVPLAAGVVCVAVALVARRPALLCIGALLLSSCLGARAWAGLTPPAPASVDAVVTLVTDPEPFDAAVRVEVRVGHRRVDAWARGEAAAALRPRLAGERVRLQGRLAPLPRRLRHRLGVRHIAGRLSVAQVGPWTAGGSLGRLANGLRRTLSRGAAPLGPDQRALFTGLVLGDDRDQSAATADDFRAAGLTHLLAVSGENVAFVLAAAWPLLRLLGLRSRFVAGLAVLVLFGVVTRWEPSVLRAEAMAALTLLAWSRGRPQPTLRLLSLAVAGLLVVDPLLVWSVGFLLSVAACAGIAVLAPPLARRLPGPRPVAAALAVTIAAQAGVAPVLAPVFGGVPVAALPANLLAVPAAGPVMTWGMTAGLVAGGLGGRVAAAVHLPTRLLLAWIAGVARWGARLPMARLSLAGVALVAAAVVAGWAARRLRVPVAVGLCLLALAPAFTAGAAVRGDPLAGGPHLWRWRGATVLVADGQAPAEQVLAGLRDHGVRRLDAVVLERGSGAARALDPVLDRYPPRAVLSAPGTRAVVGGLTVVVVGPGRATVSGPWPPRRPPTS